MAESIELKDVDDTTEYTPRKKKGKKSDFIAMSSSLLGNINYKVSFLLFAISMFIFSDIFIDNVLNKFGDTVIGECTTTKGTMLQLMFMILAYIVLDLVVKYEIL